jgi:hypothetical protein
MHYVLEDPAYVDLESLYQAAGGKPFVVAVINREELAKLEDTELRTRLEQLREKVCLKKKEFNLNDIVRDHPQIIETVVIDTGNAHESNLGSATNFSQLVRKMNQACKTAVKSRKQWRRGRSGRKERGQAVSTNSRVNHSGQLG